MKFSSSEKLVKHINSVHDDKIQSNDEFLNSKGNDEMQSKSQDSRKLSKCEHDEQPTDLSQNLCKRIKIENYATPKHFDVPLQTPGTPDVFLCNQCNASLPSFELFRLHLKSHLEENYGSGRSGAEHFDLSNSFYHSQKKFVCQQCRDVVFDNRFEYDQHVEQHYTEFLCQECDDSFTKNEDLQNHLLESHVRFKCTLCNESLESIMSLKLHFATRHSDRRCSACHEVFRSERDFKNHIQTKHSSIDLIKCIFCRVTCSSELEMHFHFLSTHVKQFRWVMSFLFKKKITFNI
jgi:zinc finger protein 423